MSDTVLSVVSLLAALLVIVGVHELGHYWMGRLVGIHATTFSLGFGPTLVNRRDRHGTTWRIGLLPLGGYVRFLGDGDDASAQAEAGAMARLSPEERRQTMHGAPLWARALTVAAGPAANIVLTLAIILASVFWYGVALDQPVVGKLHALPGQVAGQGLRPGDAILSVDGQETPDLTSYARAIQAVPPRAEVGYRVWREGQELAVTDGHPLPSLVVDVQPKSAAMDAGLQPGDVVTALDGAPVVAFSQMPPLVEAKAGAPLELTIWRAGETFTVALTPRRRDLPDGQGGFTTRWLVGLTGGSLFEPAVRQPGPIEALSLASRQTWMLAVTNLSGMAHMVAGKISACNLSGPIGMAEVAGEAARAGFSSFIGLVAAISLGIGLANLLPIPVLDGGHLVLHVIEAVRGRPPSPRVLQFLFAAGFFIIIGLMIFAVGNDLTCV